MNAHLFTPNALQPTRIADGIVKRYFQDGKLMQGVESKPIDPQLAKIYGDTYERAWDENKRDDNVGKDLDPRDGIIHTNDGRWESIESYTGDNYQGSSSKITFTMHEGEVYSTDRRELRATPNGWDYLVVQVHQSGNIEATATHIDRATREGTEQAWFLRM